LAAFLGLAFLALVAFAFLGAAAFFGFAVDAFLAGFLVVVVFLVACNKDRD
jgi:hypothetical protein